MTQNSELIALAERCEAASGTERELDAAIGRAVLGSDRAFIKAQMPAYTASLDAAMTLVDETHDIAVIWDRDERTAGAGVGPSVLAGFPMGEGKGKGLTAADAKARALTAAALRARARSEAQ